MDVNEAAGLGGNRQTALVRPSFSDYESTGQWMVATTLWQRIEDYELDLPIPSQQEISDAIDGANAGTSLGEYIGAAWDAASEIVYDMFPQFREEDDRDPIDRYGTPEHEAWLIEMERQEG
jgi:hypothetical protein